MSYTTLERCSCGATFKASGRYSGPVDALAHSWRMTHPCPNGNGSKWRVKQEEG